MAFFITLEGIEGCGKSTQANLLWQWLKSSGHRTSLTREPGGCPISDQIRAILLNQKNSALNADTELFLISAARAQHVFETIRPSLERGISVICDRYVDATLAYQGYARGLDLAKISHLNRLAIGSFMPDLTLLLDYPVEEGIDRARQRNKKHSAEHEGRFEAETTAFHKKVRSGYLELANQDKERMRILNAKGDIQTVHRRIVSIVEAFLRQRKAS